MPLPTVDDTIVAVSSAWQAACVGIIRLSGPNSFNLASRLGSTPPAGKKPIWTTARLDFDGNGDLPAAVYWFRAPRSYTGQDVVEIHTVGCLPLLRELSARLIAMGARRALPGEFTARALTLGRLDAGQVEGVLALMQSEHKAAARSAARRARDSRGQRLDRVLERLMDLLARIEAGIDFVDEEDVHFVTPMDAVQTIDQVIDDLDDLSAEPADEHRAGKPHIALVGLPNAGKSTLFNELVGFDRALVSPVLGTTRDVLSAETTLDDLPVVLQDCAGLGGTADDLELATHVATERAARLADLVLWIHAADTAWQDRETETCEQVPPRRRLVVQSKSDLVSPTGTPPPPAEMAIDIAVSASGGDRIPELRSLIAERVTRLTATETLGRLEEEPRLAIESLGRARDLAAQTPDDLTSPELVSLELRLALEQLQGVDRMHTPLDEELLDRVFSEFCVGK